MSVPLKHICNLCISESIWPTQLKAAEVVPIFKSGSENLATNYRPISLISNLAKVFEKIIHLKLLKLLYKCNIISEKQYGFRKEMGTKDALANVFKFIYNNIAKKIPKIATFLDLAKAFDTVKHEILIQTKINYINFFILPSCDEFVDFITKNYAFRYILYIYKPNAFNTTQHFQ